VSPPVPTFMGTGAFKYGLTSGHFVAAREIAIVAGQPKPDSTSNRSELMG
jgi:hypothetical protein